MTLTHPQRDLASHPNKLVLLCNLAKDLLRRYRSRILLFSCILSLSILISLGWLIYLYHYERSANELYSDVFQLSLKNTADQKQTIIDGYKNLISKYPDSDATVNSYFLLGALYLNGGELDEAMKYFNTFLLNTNQMTDLNTLALNNIGMVQQMKKNPQMALEYFNKALNTPTANPFLSIIYGNIAQAHESLNNSDKAVEYYAKAMELTHDPLIKLFYQRKMNLAA